MDNNKNQNNEQQKNESQNVASQESNKNNNVIPEEHRPALDPGQDATAKTERKGAGQQQDSAGNPVINS